ncbi:MULTISPECIES: hypothetical protein [Terrabacteria group]|uniref:hypothetical protein n=1 Tax=Bacillati TaxID=1783272 RepID=UPI00193A8CCA|nr:MULTISPECIES: hypothetical protein [Terrabacteria group]MBW9212071.1 hypothetical protein [Trueperella sp. zg.1013]QRG87123.1 hypothetical protein JOS54_02105 [Bulleidia sp. zg-1006]
MLNQFMLIGQIEKIQKSPKEVSLKIRGRKAFLDEQGECKEDHFVIKLWKGIERECLSIVSENQFIAAKGRLETNEHGVISLIAEKLAYFPMN